MRRLYYALSASVIALVVVACGQQSPTAGVGPQPPSSSQPPTPEPVQERTPVPDSQIDFSALPPSYPHAVWTQERGTVVVVEAQEGGCDKVHAEAPDQQQGQVTVVLVDEVPQSRGMCPMNIHEVSLAARLAAPLDQRKVVLQQCQEKAARPS